MEQTLGDLIATQTVPKNKSGVQFFREQDMKKEAMFSTGRGAPI